MDRLALFHALPYPLKVMAASLHGLRLDRRRYDHSTRRRVEHALERESWPPERWRTEQRQQLERLLETSLRVPYYRRLWNGRPGDPRRLEDWPLLEKEPLRSRPRELLNPGFSPKALLQEHTSGSTGTPLSLFWSRDATRRWYALVEARSRCWYGIDRHQPWAILGGRLVAAQARRRPPFWVWNRPLRQLYCSAYHLSPDLAPFYLEAFERHRIRHLYGYGSALDALAQGLEEADGGSGHLLERARALELAAAVSNAEPLYDHQRARIARVFACPVRETYGMAELVAAASECEMGNLHLWPEVGVVELLDPETGRIVDPDARDPNTGAGEGSVSGELVCTGLLNPAQPLIRYRVGDRARWGGRGCACGRGLPLLDALEGRVDDVIVTPDGRRVGRLDPVFKDDLPLREAQVIQESLARLRLRYVPAPGFSEATAGELRHRLRERVGAMEIQLEAVDSLPRSKAGKLRSVVSLVRSPEGQT
ncbi:MAG: AMP-binding protein [Holophagales bacterium]|nr:AMP-binding protein [Holophagales bacterium]